MPTPTSNPTSDKPEKTGKAAGSGKSAKPQPDIAPDAAEMEDGADPGEGEGTPVETRTTEGEGAEPKEPVRPQIYEDSRRADIAKRYRELRDKEERGETDQDGQDNSDAPTGEGEGQDNQGEEPPAEQEEEPAGAEPTQVKVVVDGKEQFVPLDELVRGYQITSAAKNRLDEAKEVLAEVKALRAQTANQPPAGAAPTSGSPDPTTQPDPSQGQQGAQHQRVEAVDPEKLASIVERIQVGDKDEGAQAMAELFELARQGGSKPVVDEAAVGRIVDQRVVQTQIANEAREATEKYSTQYPHLFRDQDLGATAGSMLRRHMIDDLKKNGVTDDQLAPIREDTRALAMAVGNVKRAGHDVRSFDKLFEDTIESVRDKFGSKILEAADAPSGGKQGQQPKPTPQSSQPAPRKEIGTPSEIQARIEKKRAAPSQPRPAGVRTVTPEAPKPKTAAQIVREMRAHRGFPNS